MFQTLKPYLYFALTILGFILGVLCQKGCTSEKRGVSVPILKTTIVTDTIFVPKETIKYVTITKPTLRIVYKDRLIPVLQPDSTPTLSVRNYADTILIVKGLQAYYNADVSGVLNTIQLGIKDTRPEQIIERVITNELTKIEYKSNVGLYAGFYGQLDGSSFGPQLILSTPKVSIGGAYNLNRTSLKPNVAPITVSIGYKIVGK